MLSSYPLNYLQWEYGQESGKEGFPYGSAGKESAYNVGDLGLIPGLGRSPGEGNGYPLQYSGLENSMDCIVHGVTKSQTWLSNFHFHLPEQKPWARQQDTTSLTHKPLSLSDPKTFSTRRFSDKGVHRFHLDLIWGQGNSSEIPQPESIKFVYWVTCLWINIVWEIG